MYIVHAHVHYNIHVHAHVHYMYNVCIHVGHTIVMLCVHARSADTHIQCTCMMELESEEYVYIAYSKQ